MENTALQYLIDGKGIKTAVIVPIGDWISLQKQLKGFEEYLRMERDLTQAMKEVNEIKSGKVPAQTLEDFLNEC